MDWIFPLLAATIYFATPKGCDKTINWILTGLFVFVWAFEEAIARINTDYVSQGLYPLLTGGLWYDGILFVLFSSVAILFYHVGGKIQCKLAAIGAALCLLYAYWGNSGLYYEETFRANYYYIEVMIALSIVQLFISGGGMMFAISNKAIGGSYGTIAGDSGNNTGHNNANNGNP